MKIDLLVLVGTVLLFVSVPMVSHAGDDRAIQSPLAAGEPMDDCDRHHHGAVIALDVGPVLPAGKAEAILATPDVAPAVAPAAIPAAVAPTTVPLPAKASPDKTTQAPRSLSPAALLTFALIASPGTALPQAGGNAPSR